MRLTKREIRRVWDSERRRTRRTGLLVGGAVVLTLLLCMCFRYNAAEYAEKWIGLRNLRNLLLALRLLLARFLDADFYARRDSLIEAAGSIYYLGAQAQLKLVLVSAVSGAGLCIAGAIFQTAYQNPMASPNMIGATAGVGLGNVVAVTIYSALALDQILLRYKFCYGFTVICVGLTLLLGKLAGDKRENYSVMEMVMVGSIVSQGINVVTMYLMYTMEDEDLLIYEELQLGTYIDLSTESMLSFFGVMALAIIPVLLMRYRMNAIGMNKLETTALGVRVGPLRLVGQLCGALMVTCAMIHCGSIGMISMVIPYAVRGLAGSDFRRVCLYSAGAGAVLLMVCRELSAMFLVLGETMPAAFIMNMLLTPLFLFILAKQGGRRYGSGA